jgi:four helix bundle protein
MALIKRFEDLEVWQASMALCSSVYALSNEESFARDYGFKDQVRRSSVSVPSNIAEGFERDSQRQFIYFLVIVKGSCGELRTQLRIAANLNYISNEEFEKLNNECISVSKQLAGFINYLKTKK